ncbi:ArsR/SmtB family transcription factor [Mariluticola halotolerans]|uniref:ArsR/SmtB family transcription factor n=1 Tax=Mariluticola halotolerans TaxID=2909283 RepID=UPI0026E14B76|nr:metalloregulator ArsR/SmtB family transcription factor [Mariluticola halotolerans]UJQ93280.1 metalloregulator ArsR/SmtB family transcription factor [Mariluticola halotolerans]
MLDSDFRALEEKAGEVATLLRALGNDKRLLILCKLAGAGEMNVTTLAGEVGLSQSALSQHLARMRTENIVATRRDSQTIWYRIADERTERLMTILYEVFCLEEK